MNCISKTCEVRNCWVAKVVAELVFNLEQPETEAVLNDEHYPEGRGRVTTHPDLYYGSGFCNRLRRVVECQRRRGRGKRSSQGDVRLPRGAEDNITCL